MSGGKFVKARKPLTGRTKRLLLVCAVLAVLSGVFFWAWQHRAGMLRTQSAAEAWRGANETPFSQISVFFPVDSRPEQQELLTFRTTMDEALLAASLEPQEGERLYRDAWSGTVSVNVSGPHGYANVKTLGVGGDFFLFHPLQLVSGSYLSDYDYMPDRVVLDEELAWTLFGGSDVAGLSVTIGERDYPVAGVIHRESDPASRKAYSDTSGMFMCFDALNAITEVPIESYEVVLADPVTDFARSTVENAFGSRNGVIVENTGRFSPLRLWKVLTSFGERSMNTHAVIYPYWENAARLCEDYAALDLLLAVLLGLFPAAVVLAVLIRLIRKLLTGAFTGTKRFFEKCIEAGKMRRYSRKGL